MSALMYGADADELDRLASEFNSVADDLDREAGTLSGFLNNISWLGDVAIRFSNRWMGTSIPQIGLSTRFLREAATRLAANAADQRRASTESGSGTFSGLGDFMLAVAEKARRLAEIAAYHQQLATVLDADLELVDNLSPAEQLAWWNGLTAEQQVALIAMRPTQLLGLDGLPADVRQLAENSFLASIADEVVTSESSITASAEFSVKIFKVGGELEVEQTTYADGSVAITLGAAVSGGVGLGKLAKAMAEAGVDGTYRFNSQAEADEFLRGLIGAVKPDSVGDVANFAPEAVKDVVQYLASQNDNLESIAVEGGVSISAESADRDAEAEIGAGVRIERNVRDDTTELSAVGHLSGGVDLGDFGVKGSADGSVGVTLDNTGTPTTLTLNVDYQGATLVNNGFGGFTAEAGTVQTGSMNIEFDLTDPDVRAALGPALQAAIRGDVGAVAGHLAGNAGLATITVQTGTGVTSEYGFDAVVVEAKVASQATVTTSTFVKPPGGSFIAYRN